MTPLSYIILLSLALIALLFVVLTSLNKREEERKPIEKLDFETAGELSPEEVRLADLDLDYNKNQIVLYSMQPNKLFVKWHLTQKTWDKIENKDIKLDDILLRVYKIEGIVKSFDFSVNATYGGQEIDCTPGTAYYCALGIMKDTGFSPLVISNTIISMRETIH
ncbi:hypothetical protein SYNTR_2271 [Candidatus Syntrophocurvum alkaliphilum]|uniref:DUF4912 domain-containing protein n=1 Tax=Candidatus Syntrophocurvum alkaliphilum TaxID=2293317 RepID=A0A6I6DE82_9FIRM|nr:DUF4912 domain-containing protein [Candidatus Syntrophocurvum alkaliphilum]QGU00865.1 hypothetical protein SYNTR_2271 [Candidatus Syntrophocurvum alkaliphilum]